MYCTRCGLAIDGSSQTCPGCGLDLSTMVQAKQELLRKRDRNGVVRASGHEAQGLQQADRQAREPFGRQATQGTDPYTPPSPEAGAHAVPQGHGQPPYYGYPKAGYAKRSNGWGLWAGIMGLVSLLGWVVLFLGAGAVALNEGGASEEALAFIGVMAMLLGLFSLVGGIVAIVGLNRANAPKGWAWTGLICNGLSVAILLLAILAGISQG